MSDRKPQARSVDTRRRLREATLDTIVDVGLPRASTPKINERAGVSNGAQQHHFPTRSDLIVSSLEELTNEYTGQLDRHLDSVAPSEGLTTVLRLIASNATEHERYRLCWIEAMVAARTSPDLGDAMRPLDNAKTERFRAVAARVATCDAGLAADIAELTAYLVRGMGLQRSLHPDADFERFIDLWCAMIETATADETKLDLTR